jgi:hypothetical protein
MAELEVGVHPHQARNVPTLGGSSVLAWSAWVRVLAVLPLVLTLWLAVCWANEGVMPW